MIDTDRLIADARRALAALDDLIFWSSDPGSEALGARYCLAATLNAIDPSVLIPLPKLGPEATAVIGVVADWYEAADGNHHNLDPDDLHRNLERAGYELPLGDDDHDAPAA